MSDSFVIYALPLDTERVDGKAESHTTERYLILTPGTSLRTAEYDIE